MKKNNTAYAKRHLKGIAAVIITITIAAGNCFAAETKTGTQQNNQGKTSYSESAEKNYNLAVKYYDEKNYAEAAKFYKKAAEQGDSDAQTDLGYIYFHGKGIPQDYSEAAKWFRKAANQGNAKAQTNLGIMYENGQGVKQEYEEAA